MPASTRRILPQVLVSTILILALLLAAGAVVVATGLKGAGTGSPAAQVLRLSNESVSDLTTLDPGQGPDFNERQAEQLIFEGLVRFDQNNRIVPDLAERWEVSPNGRTYTFHLRPGVAFADGTQLTASHIAFSLNRTLSPAFKNHAGPSFLKDIDGGPEVTNGQAPTARGIQILDAHTLRIHLSQPDGSFLAKLTTPAGYIVPQRRVTADPKHWSDHAFGTGPFIVARWVHRDRLLLAPNPHYWGGKIAITGIEMPFFPEPMAAYKRYRAGAVDVMGIIRFPPDALYEAKNLPDFHRSLRLETVFLTLNESRPPFDNMLVRQAFSRAVDRKALVAAAYRNFAHPTTGMLPPGMPGYNPRLPNTGYAPNVARALLARAGFPGGRRLPPIVYAVDQDAQAIAQAAALANQWHRVLGVQVQLVQAPTHAAYDKILDRKAYQISVIDWTADFPDPSNFLSQQFHSGSPNNNGSYSNRTFDRLADQADRMTPPQDPARLALYHRAESIAMEEAAAIPLVNPYVGIMLRQGIHGLQIDGGEMFTPNWAQVTADQGGSS